jgi:hypothetical protein
MNKISISNNELIYFKPPSRGATKGRGALCNEFLNPNLPKIKISNKIILTKFDSNPNKI